MNSWLDQLEWIRDEGGNVVCDCLRLELLKEDISEYLGAKIHVPRRNVTESSYDYRSMYTDELAEVISRVFAEDIRHFGFSFDSAATKNIATLT
ncbi:MAG: hypothetical protein WD795_05370 [Woeseia sp.]